jgi:hypothetical protein
MAKFKPILKKPGDVIRSEDWNKIQEDIKADLERIEEYISKMTETVTLTNVESPVGKSFNLMDIVPGETSSYNSNVMGLITKQWLLEKGKVGEICRFGVMDSFDILYYWSGAENGDKKTLNIVLEYMDGTTAGIEGLFIHDRTKLRPAGQDNPYIEYILSPNERVWYKYQIVNPNPEKEVRYISFKNVNAECTPRIGNVIQYKTRIKPLKLKE